MYVSICRRYSFLKKISKYETLAKFIARFVEYLTFSMRYFTNKSDREREEIRNST
jgi:hypothetical protein